MDREQSVKSAEVSGKEPEDMREQNSLTVEITRTGSYVRFI